MNTSIEFLQHIAYNLRVSSLIATTQAGSGHPTSCLSAADLVAAVFFHAMRFDPENHENPNNDRFILSKGHAAPLLYAVWHQLGVISEQDLLSLRTFGSKFEGHPVLQFPQSEAATGSLGQGLSIGLGMAYSTRITNDNFNVYVLLGDSELAEGSVWEACEIAAYYNVDNLIAIVDCNRLGQSTETMHEHDLAAYVNKFTAFGWKTFTVNGHDMKEIVKVLDQARQIKGKPTMIIAQTYKGYGVDKLEDKLPYHGKIVSQQDLPGILQQMKERFSSDAINPNYGWNAKLPLSTDSNVGTPVEPSPLLSYKHGDTIATRKAYGEALEHIGRYMKTIVSLDAEVKNSTYAELFEYDFHKRFIQCFIAEQNMVSMAVGLASRGLVPFASTFGAFFSRAFDQIRMAAIGTSPLRLVGSHAGISIGEDGPSQMALEDIAMMRTLPGSVVLYPADAQATARLVESMAHRFEGITYLRTTRMATPVIYDRGEEFPIGGCKVVRQSGNDIACVVGAGITLFEALKAYEELKAEGICISVIDVYSVKPLDVATLHRIGIQSKGRIITVEDHYRAGGIGEAIAACMDKSVTVTILAVDMLPCSGKPEELLAAAKIDAQAIIKTALMY